MQIMEEEGRALKRQVILLFQILLKSKHFNTIVAYFPVLCLYSWL